MINYMINYTINNMVKNNKFEKLTNKQYKKWRT